MCKHIILRYRQSSRLDAVKGTISTDSAGDGVKDEGGAGNAELKVRVIRC